MSKVFKAVKKAVKSVVKAVTKVVKSVINFVGDVVGFVLNPFGAFDTPDINAQNADVAAQGVTVTKNGTNIALPVVYGFRRIGGALVYAETGSTNNQYLYTAFALCEGPIEGIKRIIVDDVALPLPSNFYTDGAVVDVTSGKFNGRIKFQVRYGYQATNSNVDSSLRGPNWDKKQRPFTRAAFVVMRFYWKEIKTQADADNNPFNGGIPNVKFDILGKRVMDVRRYSEPYSNFTYAPFSTANPYSFNPANIILDYMLNPEYGAGLTESQIDFESFKVAAKKYAQTVSYNNNYSGPALTMNAVVDTNTKVLDNLKRLLQGARAMMTYTQGKYKIKVEDGGNDTDISSTSINIAFDVDKNYVVGGITLDGERKKTKYNEVIVNWVDPDREFTNQQAIYTEAADLALDNDEKLVGEFTFHTISNPAIAWETARMIYKKSRSQKTITFNGTQELLNLEVGDIIRVTDTILQLSLDTFRVVGLQLNNDLTVAIDAVEHDATIYPATGGVGQISVPPQVFLPDELSVRPRKKDISLQPLSVVPPNNPDSPVTVVDVNGDPTGATTPVLDSAGEPIVDSAGETAGSSEEDNALPEPEIVYNIIEDFQSPGVKTPQGPIVGDEELIPLLGSGYIEINPARLEQAPTTLPATDSDPTWKTYANPIAVYPNTHLPYILYNNQKYKGSGYFTVESNKGLMTTPDLTTDNNFRTAWVQDPNNPVYGTLPSGIQYVDRWNYNYAGEHWAFVFSQQMAERGNSQFDIQAALQLNLPQDTSFNQYIFHYESENENWSYGGSNNLGGSNFDPRFPGMTRAYFYSISPPDPADPTKKLFARNVRFRWRKATVDGILEFEDRSQLDASYSWFDYKDGKQKLGNTIEDFCNYWLQNSGLLWQVAGQQPSPSQTTVTTSHNLGA